jgi:ribosomal protein L34
MLESEVRAILRAHGWRWRVHTHYHQTYVYARRRKKGAPRSKFEERYLCPLSRLPELTEAELMRKLTR